jgi:hypothetical protein
MWLLRIVQTDDEFELPKCSAFVWYKVNLICGSVSVQGKTQLYCITIRIKMTNSTEAVLFGVGGNLTSSGSEISLCHDTLQHIWFQVPLLEALCNSAFVTAP